MCVSLSGRVEQQVVDARRADRTTTAIPGRPGLGARRICRLSAHVAGDCLDRRHREGAAPQQAVHHANVSAGVPPHEPLAPAGLRAGRWPRALPCTYCRPAWQRWRRRCAVIGHTVLGGLPRASRTLNSVSQTCIAAALSSCASRPTSCRPRRAARPCRLAFASVHWPFATHRLRRRCRRTARPARLRGRPSLASHRPQVWRRVFWASRRNSRPHAHTPIRRAVTPTTR